MIFVCIYIFFVPKHWGNCVKNCHFVKRYDIFDMWFLFNYKHGLLNVKSFHLLYNFFFPFFHAYVNLFLFGSLTKKINKHTQSDFNIHTNKNNIEIVFWIEKRKKNKKHFYSEKHLHTARQKQTIFTQTHTKKRFIYVQTSSPHVYSVFWFCDGAANVPSNAPFVIYTDANGQV